MKITGIIPARYASTRFPGKPLVDIGGKTMIRRVYEQAAQSKSLSSLIVATDDARIFDEVKSFGGNVLMTKPNHHNGTERCAEVASALDTDVIINIQGDEPFIHPLQIDLLASLFTSDNSVQLGTLIKEHPIDEEFHSPSRIKVVVNKSMEALYFSRGVIPFLRAESNPNYYKHIGIYGYKKEMLLKIVQLPASPLELAESLEQLRWLENGYAIKCAVTEHESQSIDTPEDLEKVQRSI